MKASLSSALAWTKSSMSFGRSTAFLPRGPFRSLFCECEERFHVSPAARIRCLDSAFEIRCSVSHSLELDSDVLRHVLQIFIRDVFFAEDVSLE